MQQSIHSKKNKCVAKQQIRKMYKNYLCCFFSNEEKYDAHYFQTNQNLIHYQLAANTYSLPGIGILPNEIIVEFLFPHLGIYDIRNLGEVGDNRLKCLVEDYLCGSKYTVL